MNSAQTGSPRKRLIVHVGYPKTATTTLQDHVFPALPGVDYWGKPKRYGRVDTSSRGGGNVWRAERAICLASDAEFERQPEDLLQLLRGALMRSDAQTVVWSNEEFLCPSRPLRKGGAVMDLQRTARRLHNLLAVGLSDLCDTHVLITLRRQADLLPSYYAQFSGEEIAGGLYAEGFENFRRLCASADRPSYGALFDYDAMVASYQRIFGAEKICVLPMEGLLGRGDGPVRQQLSDILGVDAMPVLDAVHSRPKRSKSRSSETAKQYVAYRSTDGLRTKAWRLVDKLFPKEAVRSGRPPSIRVGLRKVGKRLRPREVFQVDEGTRVAIARQYAESNERLDTRLALGLKHYDYY